MPNLVGIGLSQVPTNSMLGGMAYQDPEHASIKNLDLKNLSQINSEIADTAVDVFVYDTRKDSDGGAWRKRTQNTSWYNETLGTATRGTRKEFPAVAVIVTETTKVTIYDGDDPDLPMWMVFTWSDASVDNLLGYNDRAKSAITAVNGYLITCSDPDGIHIARFIHDDGIRYTHVNHVYTSNSIANRTNTTYRTINTTSLLVASTCNDIAATVLPNAPIDSATGLPIPTIAVATAGGVSVIKDDGIVVDVIHTAFKNITQIFFTEDNLLAYLAANTINQTYGFHYIKIPSGDLDNGTDGRNVGTHDVRFYNGDGRNYIPSLGSRAYGHNFIDGAIGYSDASSGGLTLLEKDVPQDYENSSIAFVNTDFNTGWMHGDCKGAFLSDTDTTNASYTTVADDWATAGAWTKQSNISITSTGSGTSGTLSISGANNGSNVYFFNGITVEANTDYVVTITFGAYNANAFLINTTQYSTSGSKLDIHGLSGLTRGGHFNSGSSTTLYIQGYQVSSNATTITNITVQKVSEYDRSVNNKGLAVFGTVTKTAVATGADLVAYSGFSNSNYLIQPPNSDMQTGTGDFSVTCWFKTTSTVNAYEGLIYYNTPGSIGKGFQIILGDSAISKALYFYIYGTSTLTSGQVTGLNDGNWHCAVATHTSSQIQLYIDGKLEKSASHSVGSIANVNAQFTVGRWYGNTTSQYYWRGSIALVRHSKSIPSDEQIKKIYEDEKVLFQENAKATLYGSSDAVTALAFDDTTNLLHAGTSAGRSEFQGLCRINNTTDAVTTAISASNGLVAEQ